LKLIHGTLSLSDWSRSASISFWRALKSAMMSGLLELLSPLSSSSLIDDAVESRRALSMLLRGRSPLARLDSPGD